MKLSALHTKKIEEGWKERIQAMVLGGAIGSGLGYGIANKLNALPKKPQTTQNEPEAPPEAPPEAQEIPEKAQKEPRKGVNKAIHVSDLMKFIEPFEGRRNTAYDDSVGKRTVGVGLNLDDREEAKELLTKLGYDYDDVYAGRTPLSDKDIESLFSVDVMTALKDAKQAVDNFDNLPRKAKLIVVDMLYNMGLPRFQGSKKHRVFKKLIKALNAGDFQAAAREMVDSDWYNQVGRRSRHHVNVMKSINNITESIERLLLEGADLIDVLSKHFPNLMDVLVKHNVDTSNLSLVGRGDKGTAFTDGNVIIKVTEDRNEAMASANLIGANIPHVNKIYTVYKFSKEIPYQEEGDEEPIDTPYYLIIQDLLDTKLDRNEKAAAEAVGDFLISMNRRLPWPFNPSALVRHVKNHHYMRKHEILGGPGVDNAILVLLGAVSNLFARKHIRFLDVSSGNVGKDRDGNLTLFDLGVSESPKLAFKAI
jgi:lysozyme